MYKRQTVKVVGTVAHQWIDVILNIQRSRTPFVFELCLIPLQSVLNTDTDESWRTLCVRLSLSSPTVPSQIVAQQGAMPKCTITVSQLVAFFCPMFYLQYSCFHWMRNVCCRGSSCLDLVTAQAIMPQLTSDSVSNTHQMPRVV